MLNLIVKLKTMKREQEASYRNSFEWISVDKKMPEKDVYVLVLGKDGSMSVRYIPTPSREGNCSGDDGESWYPGGWNVCWTTHWMRLPSKPKKKIKEIEVFTVCPEDFHQSFCKILKKL